MASPLEICELVEQLTWPHLFGPLKEKLRGKKFNGNDGVKENVLNWLRHRDKDFFAASIKMLIKDGTSVSMLLEIMLKNKKMSS